ncbi:MAG: hypothetical protein AUI52_05475 [Acidobacteria bacterium 13_1_40CM_2_68_10]|nr:MAG: hypothetical protein AUI52_05475 [Acidobacteria bacterium 13_1_40CM_2_68_10]
MMLVWVFVLTLALAGGPVVVEFGPYPTREACQRDFDAVTFGGGSFAWSKTVCYVRAAGLGMLPGGDALPWGTSTDPVLGPPSGQVFGP